MHKNPIHPLEEEFQRFWPLESWQKERVLVALSGGADSVGLLRAICAVSANSRRVFAAHFNHGLRLESRNDEPFVQQLCSDLGVELIVKRADPDQIAASKAGEGMESALRTVRYQFLVNTAKRLGARYVATAHHKDDQVETILHNIIRGTGITGLRGMQQTRKIDEAVFLVRPLLTVSRNQIHDYLHAIGQAYRTDESNRDCQFTRNRIRHELIPFIEEKFNSKAKESILRLASLADATQSIVDESVSDALLTLLKGRTDADDLAIELSPFMSFGVPLQREMLISIWKNQGWPLQDMGLDDWNRILTLCADSGAKSIHLPGAIRAWRDNGQLFLKRLISQ